MAQSRQRILLSALSSLLVFTHFALGEEGAGTPALDVTSQAKEINSERFAAPPMKFRKGAVTPRTLDADVLKKQDTGFTLQLPSHAPIPTPTIYKDKLYVGGGFHSKEFYCFDAKNGNLVWGVNLDDDGPTSAVCEDDITVFNTESCTVFALHALTGKLLWSHWLGDPLTSTPTIAASRVFTSYPANGGGGEDNESKRAKGEKQKERPKASHVLACLDLKNGQILWQRWIDSDVMSAPVAVGSDLYVTSFAGIVYKLRQSDGEILSAQKTRATSAPVVVGDNVFLTRRADAGKGTKAFECASSLSLDLGRELFASSAKEAKYLDERVQARSGKKGEAMALDAANGFGGGAPAAANFKAAGGNIGQDNVSSMQAFQGSRVLHLGGRNFSCMGDELVCTESKDGKTAWSVKLKGDLEKEGGSLGSSPAAAGTSIFVATLKGELLEIDSKSGKSLKSYPVGAPCRFQPAIVDGYAYVTTQDGKVVRINTGDAKKTGWTTWGANSAHTGLVAVSK